MIVLYCLLALTALITLLLLVPVRVRLKVDENGALSVRVQAARISVYRHPSKSKEINLRRYSPRAIAKRQKKQAKLRKKKTAKKAALPQATVKKKATLSQKVKKLTDTLSLITSLIDALHEKAFRAAHIHLYALTVRIGTSDAAKTALLYGAVCPAVSALLQTIHECSNLHLHHPKRMSVQPDFVHETFHVEIDLALQLRVHHLLALGLRAISHISQHKQARTTKAPHKLPTASVQ